MVNVQIYRHAITSQEAPLCLIFANSLVWRRSSEPVEEMNTYVDLLEFCQLSGAISEQRMRYLLGEFAQRPEEAAKVFRRAIAIREAFYHTVSNIWRKEEPNAEALTLLNRELSELLAHMEIERKGESFTWVWKDTADSLRQVLFPILQSIMELLTSDNLQRVGVCQGEGCGWLFFDTSRNRSRKWCTMDVCGNRIKARRFYKKGKQNEIGMN